MEFYQLEAFVSVVAHKSFSRAAETLFLSQPTVSTHVKSLESEFGRPLFDRGKSELILTPAGEILYRYARDLLEMRDRARAEVRESGLVGVETLAIAASSVPCQYLLPRLLAEFEKLFPQVSVSLKQENSRRVCEDVFNYHYALGVVGEQHSLPRLSYLPLIEDELVVAFPAGEEYQPLAVKEQLSPEDLSPFRLLLREPGSGTRSLLEKELSGAGQDLRMFTVSIYDSQETIKQAVRQGLGLTVISRYVVEDYEQFGLLRTRPMPGLNLRRRFYLVCHEKRVMSAAAAALRDHLLSTLANGGKTHE
jgi:DNA-binding transcriptional LysR family regulator